MSVENQTAIELSEQELDVVAGGAISDAELALYKGSQNNFSSVLTADSNGVNSSTTANQTKITSFGIKAITLS